MQGNKSEQEILDWYEKDLLPRLVAEGKFPVDDADSKSLKITELKHEETNKGTDHFASVPYFTQMTLQDSKNASKKKKFKLITKFITQNMATREAMETDVQFYNEMIFYNEIIPAFKKFLSNRTNVPDDFLDEICPVCRYAHIDLNSPDYGVVIMDDLREKSYACAQSKAELSLDFCLVALKKLAKFHAVSYAMKIEHFQGLEDISQSFKECRYQDNSRFKQEGQDIFISKTCSRGFDYLLSHSDLNVPASYINKLENKVKPEPYKMMQEFIKPKEPLAVICHGDFCRNNILFLLENEKAIDCKLFDYQTWRYATPAIDLTFFIYMNTTIELREKHFDELLTTYHDTLVETISAITCRSNSEIKEIYPYQLFFKDFGDHSMYGYSLIAFFLPMMMAPAADPGSFEKELFEKTFQELTEDNIKLGGEVVTKRVAEVVIDMYRRKFYVEC